VPFSAHALVIVDRAGWHMTKAIRCFSNVTLLPLPPYSPELNPVEQLWQQIKQFISC
jgi:transposase